MANIGLKNFKYAKLNEDGKTYGEVKTLAGAIECKVSIDRTEATLYADDTVKEQVSIFKSGCKRDNRQHSNRGNGKKRITPAKDKSAGISNRHKENPSARCAPAQPVDFSWLLFVGVNMLGFTEPEVGHMTLKKWNLLFNHLKKYHNFIAKAGLFKEEKEATQSDEWIKD